MGVSSPTGNGEKRGMEWATQPGTPLGLRPARAKANQAASSGTHDMDSAMAADGRVDMKDDGKFTKITVASTPTITNANADNGAALIAGKVILKGKMNR